MKVLLDSDGASVREITQKVCKKFNIPLFLVKNYTQDFDIFYGNIVNVDISKEAADLWIVNHATSNDLVITNDKGLSSMALAKKAVVLDFSGKIINNNNILGYLENRHISRILRKDGIYTKIPKRKKSENNKFELELTKILRRMNMYKFFISSLCPDCPPAIELVKEKGIDVETIDITSSMKNLKEFLNHRDNSDAFDEIVENNMVGVPCLYKDGRYFFFDYDIDDFINAD
ncbi:uncharacterized protein YaiI (UPF0178 family)/glutaredoxin-related protein [Peptoniphilus olsenii]|uniref:Uncharacterized protein YaiI (UPF0178 family)/glutaredoxin-related protein n=1 Tax=Peptoniphilus olsenii TaxID=411570 RepID=A0ABV2J8Q2_9FIRM